MVWTYRPRRQHLTSFGCCTDSISVELAHQILSFGIRYKWIHAKTTFQTEKKSESKDYFFYFLFLFLFFFIHVVTFWIKREKKIRSFFCLSSFSSHCPWSVVLIARVWQCSFFEISCNVSNTVAECSYTNTIRYGDSLFRQQVFI